MSAYKLVIAAMALIQVAMTAILFSIVIRRHNREIGKKGRPKT